MQQLHYLTKRYIHSAYRFLDKNSRTTTLFGTLFQSFSAPGHQNTLSGTKHIKLYRRSSVISQPMTSL